jgi:hypothetical protein
MRRSFAIRLATGALLVLSVLVASAVRGEAKPPTRYHSVAMLEADVADSRYRLRMLDALPEGKTFDRRLEIDCIATCPHPVHYAEKIGDYPLSVFRFWDDSDQFITIWVAGSAYVVRIYRIDKQGVTKVLEAGTKSAPQFVDDADGNPAVILTFPDSADQESRLSVSGIIWQWDGTRYVQRPGKH